MCQTLTAVVRYSAPLIQRLKRLALLAILAHAGRVELHRGRDSEAGWPAHRHPELSFPQCPQHQIQSPVWKPLLFPGPTIQGPARDDRDVVHLTQDGPAVERPATVGGQNDRHELADDEGASSSLCSEDAFLLKVVYFATF